MSHIASTAVRCNSGRGVTVERRIATALLNEQERERIIALKAHEVFCSRGCENGFDVEDWLRAEQELASKGDDVLLTQSPNGLDISIAERLEEVCIVLSMASSNLLILWSASETDTGEQGQVVHSTLSLTVLPKDVDPENADVTFRDGRVWLHLPYFGQARSLEAAVASDPKTKGRRALRVTPQAEA